MLSAPASEIGAASAPLAAPSAAALPAALGARDATHAGWRLGPDETVVWQGRPSVMGLANRAFRLPLVAAYFGALAAWGLIERMTGGAAIDAFAMPLASGIATFGSLLMAAWLIARTTAYTVTTDRIILRYGAVLPRSLSIPFKQVAALSLSVGRDRRGDVALTLRSGNRIPYLKLWPHVRLWHVRRPQPMLTAVQDGAEMATRLARQLQETDRLR